MNGYYSVAIDGPSGAGKSSLARALAKTFDFIYVDTGAIYRTVALFSLKQNSEKVDKEALIASLPKLEIQMRYNESGEQRMYLNGEDVSAEIRKPEVSLRASDVAAMPEIRAFLLNMQRSMAQTNNVIMDGRDIATVVLPQAELKIFLTASAEARAKRRMLELEQKGMHQDYEDVLREIIYRDEQDSSRASAPLRKADDAILVDTSEIDFEQSLNVLCEIMIRAFSLEVSE